MFVIQSEDFFSNLQKLPAFVDSAWGRYQSWVYEDEEWRGHWGIPADGYADIESMHLAGDAQIDIDANRGELSGAITTRQICRKMPLLGGAMFEGSVSGDTAVVHIYDYVNGSRVALGKIRLERTGSLIEIIPVDDRQGLFAPPTRIARETPSSGGDTHEPRTETANISEFCRTEKLEFMMELNRTGSQLDKRDP